MNSFYSLLTFVVMVTAKPHEQYEPAVQSTIISQGPWITDDAWAADANRDPKEIEQPSQGIFERLGSWWSWDR